MRVDNNKHSHASPVSAVANKFHTSKVMGEGRCRCNAKSIMSMSSAIGPNLDAQFEYEARYDASCTYCTHDRTLHAIIP